MLRCLNVILLLAVAPTSIVAAETPTSAPLVIVLRDTMPVPNDLVPALKSKASTVSGLAGEIIPFTVGRDLDQWYGSLKALIRTQNDEFITSAPVDREDLWLMIDHPGYLRMYSVKIPILDDPKTTVVLNLPERGQLKVNLDLNTLRKEADSEERWQEALKGYCITSHVSIKERFSYQANYSHALLNWEYFLDDIAPGKYELFGTGRWCDARTGPAGYGGKVEFVVKPGFRTEFALPLVKRHEFDVDKPQTPVVRFEELEGRKK